METFVPLICDQKGLQDQKTFASLSLRRPQCCGTRAVCLDLQLSGVAKMASTPPCSPRSLAAQRGVAPPQGATSGAPPLPVLLLLLALLALSALPTLHAPGDFRLGWGGRRPLLAATCWGH